MKGGRCHDCLGNDPNDRCRSTGDYGYTIYFVYCVCQIGKPPAIITYLGDMLPAAVMGLLVVYSLKDVSLTQSPNGIPEAIALIILGIIHYWRRNLLLSIAVGTIVYMFLVQQLF